MAADLSLNPNGPQVVPIAALKAGFEAVVLWLDGMGVPSDVVTMIRPAAVAGVALEAALPHILEAVARPFDVDDPHAMIYMSEAADAIWSLGGSATDSAASEPVEPETTPALTRIPTEGSGSSESPTVPIAVPWQSTPDAAGDRVRIDRSRSDGHYFITSAATYMTPQALDQLGDACKAIAKLPPPEALPPIEGRRPRRRPSCEDGA